MSISVECRSCKRRYKAKDDSAGRTTKCPSCGAEITVPGRENPSHEVFVSYSKKDQAVADAVVSALEQAGFRCWVASRSLQGGESWAGSIVDAIQKARVLVVIYSSHTNRSPHVFREIERAVNHGLGIVQYRIENAPMSGDLEYFLSCLQWIDAGEGQHSKKLPELTNVVGTVMQSPQSAAHPAWRKRASRRVAIRAALACLVVAIAASSVAVWAKYYRAPAEQQGSRIVERPEPESAEQQAARTADERRQVLKDIAQSIFNHIRPESWDTAGGKGKLSTQVETIVCSNSLNVHGEIDNFLNKQRKIYGLPERFADEGNELMDRAMQALRKDLPKAMNYTDTPLEDVVMDLSQEWSMPIQLDLAALEAIGVAADEPVNTQLSGISCRDGLKLMVKHLGLKYFITTEGVVVVTTPESVETAFTTKTYDVKDLIDASIAGATTPATGSPQ